MSVSSIVSFSTIGEQWRLDAEYWHPAFTDNETILAAAARRMNVGLVRDLVRNIRGSAFYPSFVEYYGNTGMPFIRVADLGVFFVAADQVVRVDPDVVARYRQIATLREGDIVVAKGGSIGGVCLIQPGLGQCAVCRDVIGLETDPNLIVSEYLVAFLRSRFGQLQLDRNKSQQVQPHLTFPAVGDVRVAYPDREAQQDVARLVHDARHQSEQATALYQQSDTVLLEALGIKDIDLSSELYYTSSSVRAAPAGRLDAEHHQPKYARVVDAIRRTRPQDVKPLGSLLQSITNGHTPLRHDLSCGDVLFLTAEHIADFRIRWDTAKRITSSHHAGELERTRLDEGDVLFTIKGRVGNAAVVDGLPRPANINQDVALLRPFPEFPPYYLAAYLNSPVGKALSEQYSTGQINPFLGLGNLQQLPIPVYRADVMQHIAQATEATTRAACEAAQRSADLLEAAVTAVEHSVLGGAH